MKKFMKKNHLYIISFLIPFMIMISIFIARKVFPFGDNSFLHIDMYHQYFPFLVEFFHKLKNGESLFYSWHTGIGSNFIALYVYYLASPLNWLAIFCPEKFLMEFITYIAILRIAFCGSTMAYYLSKHYHTDHMIICCFSTFYALSGYIAAYNWNVMWLDCFVLAPLIILGLERLVSEGNCKLYCITLGLSILSNYYISILICEFLVLYFIVLLIAQDPQKTSNCLPLRFPVLEKIHNFYIKAFFRFGIYSLLAGGMASILLIPEVIALRFTEFSNFNFPSKVTTYFSVIDMLARHCMNVTVETGLDHWPNIYCGVAAFFLLPLYIMYKHTTLREKLPKLGLLFFMLISYSTNMLNFIWHCFNYPDSLPARQSFLYIILLISLCFEAFLHLKEYSQGELIRVFCGVVFFLLLCEKLITDDSFTSVCFLLSGGMIVAYGILIHIYRNRKVFSNVFIIITVCLVIFEACENTATTSMPVVSRSSYFSHFDDYKDLLKQITEKDPSLYRIEKYTRKTQNDAELIGFNSASLFSSTSNALVKDFYKKYGMKSSKVYYCYDGSTPLIDALLGVKYKFSSKEIDYPDMYSLENSENGIYLYKNDYYLPIGYMIDTDMVDSSDTNRLMQSHTPSDSFENDEVASTDEPMNIDISSSYNALFNSADHAIESITDSDDIALNPFEYQNLLAQRLNVDTNLFDSLYVENNGTHATIQVEKSGHIFAYTTNKKIENITAECGERSQKFTQIKRKYVLDLGYYETGDEIYLSSSNDEDLNLISYRFNKDVFDILITNLRDQPFEVTSYSSASISGHISVTTEGQFVLSVPYEPGWTIKVDGQKQDINLFEDVFMSVPLNVGKHTIELQYTPSGLYIGILISVLSILLFIAITFTISRYSKNKNIKTK